MDESGWDVYKRQPQLFPVDTEYRNPLVYYLVGRSVIVGYQSEIFSAFQPGCPALLDYIDYLYLTYCNVYFSFTD